MVPEPIARSKPREDETFARLCAQAHELGPGSKLPRHSELLVQLGVSKRTLDAALYRMEAEQLIQRIQGSGIYTLPAARAGAAVLVEASYLSRGPHGVFWEILLDRLKQRLGSGAIKLGMHITVPGQLDETAIQDGLREEIRQGKVRTILAIGVPVAVSSWLEERGVRVVAFGGPAQCAVGVDLDALVRGGARHLASRGCKRLQLWAPIGYRTPRQIPVGLYAQTAQAFDQEIRNLGLDPAHNGAELLWAGTRLRPVPGYPDYRETDETEEEQGYRRARETFDSTTTIVPDGLIITNDQMTRGVVTALRQLGMEPGKHVQIVSHANAGSRLLQGFADNVSLVEVDPNEIVSALLECVQRAMEPGANLPESVTVPVHPALFP